MNNPERLLKEIEKLREAEKELRDKEERYRALFEQSPYGILIINPESLRAVEFNDTAHRQLGYTREEFAGLSISEYESLEKPEETKARIEKILLIGRDDFETKHRTKNGDTRDVAVIVQTIELRGMPYLHVIFNDITERKRLENEIREKLDEVERMNKLMVGREIKMEEMRKEIERLKGSIRGSEKR